MNNELDNTIKEYQGMVTEGKLSLFDYVEAMRVLREQYGVRETISMMVDENGDVWQMPPVLRVPYVSQE